MEEIVETTPMELNDSAIREAQLKSGILPDGDIPGIGPSKEPAAAPDEAAKEKIEKLARKGGWVPKDDFQGPDDAWLDAESWLMDGIERQNKGKSIVKLLSNQNRELRKSIDDLKHINDTVYAGRLRDLEGELKTLREERKAAIADADVVRVDALDNDIGKLNQDITVAKTKLNEATTHDESNLNPVFVEWKEENNWYETDKEMTAYADKIALKYDGAPLDRILQKVDDAVREVFPEKFNGGSRPAAETEPDRQRRVNAVESGGRRSSGKGGGALTFAQLTDVEKQSCSRFVRNGVMTQEQYLKEAQKLRDASRGE